MEYFRFVPPTLLAVTAITAIVPVMAAPSPQVSFTGGVGGPASSGSRAPKALDSSAPTQNRFRETSAPAAPAPVAPAPAAPAPAAATPAASGPGPSGNPPTSTRFFPGFPGHPTPAQQPPRAPHHQVLPGFGGFIPSVNANSNQGLANLGAGAGLAGVGAVAASNCIFGQNCDLSFRPSLGAAIDANGKLVPQLGVTTQVGDGRGGVGTTFTGGLQLDGKSQNGIGGFVAGGINDGNSQGIGLGAQTGFGFSQNAQGNLDATAQLGGNVQGPGLAGVQFNRPNTALGVQPTLLGQARPELNLLNLFNQGGRGAQQGAQQPQPQPFNPFALLGGR